MEVEVDLWLSKVTRIGKEMRKTKRSVGALSSLHLRDGVALS